MNIAIGTDHRGFTLKESLKQQDAIKGVPVAWIDVGAFDAAMSDYPEYAVLVSKAIHERRAEAGILMCGNGVGMAITANRFTGIYAALAWNESVARLSKEHDNANILVLPADYVSVAQANKMIEVWLTARFKGGRYEQRLTSIDRLVR